MFGKKSVHASECVKGGFIGTDFGIQQFLSKDLEYDWRLFNKRFIPIYLESRPDKTKISAGLVLVRDLRVFGSVLNPHCNVISMTLGVLD
jgi:hypothetical protein